ncbi:hypothetical protein BGZ49_008617 [Haplosporangium sp. Z 27]|nr:hypothetical protein BGZ49_008617 [Haplosporangium sp. Z 27]
MTSRTLPPECLELIFVILQEDNDSQTLSTLLRVSKSVQTIALPLLYNNPFRYFTSLKLYQQHRHKTYEANTLKLVKLLLRCVPNEPTITRNIKVGYGSIQPDSQTSNTEDPTEPMLKLFPNGAEEQRPPSIDYLALVSEIHMKENITPPELYAYIRAYYMGLDPEILPTFADDPMFHYVRAFRDADVYVISKIHDDLALDVTWALCCDRLEQIQSVTIHIKDIQRYLQVVNRFKSLVRIGIKTGQTASETDKYKLSLLDQLFQFVQQHTAVVGTLQAIDFPSCPTQFHKPLRSALPKLISPVAIDKSNFFRFCAQSEVIDCSRIESIRMPIHYSPFDYDFKVFMQSTPYLKNCRSLQKYEMPFFGTELDSFQFVVTEKNNAGFSPEHPNNAVNSRNRNNSEPRLMVKHIKTQSQFKSLESWLDEVTYAFSESLETLEVKTGTSNPRRFGLESSLFRPPVITGKNWVLPCLRRLKIQKLSEGLLLNTNILSNCPFLEVLDLIDLSDYHENFGFNEIAFQEPFHAPKLKELRLRGLLTLGFHPDTLRCLPMLEVLSLVNNTKPRDNRYRSSIPKSLPSWMTNPGDPTMPRILARLRDTTVWSWDWHLPRLSVLKLYGEFALYFPLQKLQFMPLVHTLHLHTGIRFSIPNSLKKRMNVSEFMVNSVSGSQPSPSNYAESNQSSIFSLPKLKNLYLGGPWELSCETLRDVFSQVTPNLKCISESMGGSLTILEWIKATSVLEHLLVARSDMVHQNIYDIAKEVGMRDDSFGTRISPQLHGFDDILSQTPTLQWPDMRDLSEIQRQNIVKYSFGHNTQFIRFKQ